MKINNNLKYYIFYIFIVFFMGIIISSTIYFWYNKTNRSSIYYDDYYLNNTNYYENEISNYKKGINNGNVAPFGDGFLQVKLEGFSYNKDINTNKNGGIENVKVLIYKEGYFKNKNTQGTHYILKNRNNIWVMQIYNDNWGIIGCKEEACDFTSKTKEFIEPFDYYNSSIYN